MQSITLQTSDSAITSSDILGRVNFAASAESDGGAAILQVASIYVMAEGTFSASSNPASIIFATSTSDASAAQNRLKITHDGHFLPMTSNTYDLGSTSLRFKSTHTNALTINGAYSFPTSDGSADQVLKTDGAGNLSFTTVSTGGLSNIVEDTTPQLGGTLDANGNSIDMGTNTITDTKVGQWDTAYGWGDHSTQGYLTTDSDTTYTAGSGLTLVGTEFNTAGTGNFTEIQFPAPDVAGAYYSSGQYIGIKITTDESYDINNAQGILIGHPDISIGDHNYLSDSLLTNSSNGSNILIGSLIGSGTDSYSTVDKFKNNVIIGNGAANNDQSRINNSTIIGNGALYNVSGCNLATVIGNGAGRNASNLYGVIIGPYAAVSTTNSYGVLIGGYAAEGARDCSQSVAIGYHHVAAQSTGFYRSLVLGAYAQGYSGSGNHNILLGNYAGAFGIKGHNNIDIHTQNASVETIIGTNNNKLHIEKTIIGDTSSKLLAIGNVTSSDLTPDATLEIKPNATTDVGLIVQAVASHSASLQEWQNSSETKLLAVGPDGGLEIPSNTPSTTTNKLYNDGSNLKFGTDVIIDSTNVNTGLQYQPLAGGLNVTGLTTTEFAAATLVTESDAISSNDNDTTIPTSAAVKDYVDGQGFVTSLSDLSVTSTAAELNILDGVTATTAELNYVDGVTSNIQTQLDAKAALASPTFTGTPAAPTAAAGTNTTQVATTAYVTTAIDNLVGGAPGALDTLNELAAAINDDASYASTITTALATKLENIVEDTTPQLGGTLDANGNTIDMGTYVITDTKVGQWDTAYGWGDHSSAGYLTAHPTISAASSSDNSGRTYIQDITLDSNGHVTGLTTATETVTDTQLSQEQVEDYAGNLISTGGTKTGITVTYQDLTNDVDFVVGGLTTTEFAAATLVTSSEGISSNNNDTTIPTSAAVKAYADSVAGGGGGSPGGSDTQIQFNDGGSFGGDADLVWNKTTNALTITGSLNATTKSFLIDHPSKPGMKLQYASLEGPENGVYVRGTTDSGTITLPDYWRDLVHNSSITVTLTPVGQFQPLFVEQKSNREIRVGGVCGHYDYVVYGERKDVDKLEVEW